MALQLLSQFKKSNNKLYKYYSIAEPYREDGKNKKNIIIRLGRLEDAQALKIKNALKLCNDTDRDIVSLRDLSLEKTYYYLDVALVHSIIKELKLDRIIVPTKAIVDINKIFSLLLIHRIIQPGSKLSAVRWIKRTVLRQILKLDNLEIEPQYIYRALPEIEKSKERIENHLYSYIKGKDFGLENIFYDLTTSYFEGTHVDKAAFSVHSKDHREDRLQLILGILVNNEGLPFSWDIYKGNQGESTTLVEQVDKLKERFKLSSTLLVFDRGFLSQKNLEYVIKKGFNYLTGLDSPQIETLISLDVYDFFETLNENNVEEKLSRNDKWEKYDDNKYYLKDAYNKLYNGHKTVISFDIDRFKRSRYLRGNRIVRFRDWVEKHNKWLADFKKDATKKAIIKDVESELKRQGLKKYIQYELYEYKNKNQIFQPRRNILFPSQGYYRKVKTYKIVFKFNSSEKLDGLFALISSPNSRLSVEEMIYHYREKTKIEAAFRTMKSLLKLRPWFVYKEEHVYAHYTICVAAYFIEKIIDIKLKNSSLKDEGYTVQSLLEELKEIMVGMMKLGKKYKLDMVSPSPKIKSILKTLNSEKLLNPSLLLN